jgi:hypothetical protein
VRRRNLIYAVNGSDCRKAEEFSAFSHDRRMRDVVIRPRYTCADDARSLMTITYLVMTKSIRSPRQQEQLVH